MGTPCVSVNHVSNLVKADKSGSLRTSSSTEKPSSSYLQPALSSFLDAAWLTTPSCISNIATMFFACTCSFAGVSPSPTTSSPPTVNVGTHRTRNRPSDSGLYLCTITMFSGFETVTTFPTLHFLSFGCVFVYATNCPAPSLLNFPSNSFLCGGTGLSELEPGTFPCGIMHRSSLASSIICPGERTTGSLVGSASSSNSTGSRPSNARASLGNSTQFSKCASTSESSDLLNVTLFPLTFVIMHGSVSGFFHGVLPPAALARGSLKATRSPT